MKKIISIALTLIMLLSATSVFAFGAAAAEAPSVPSVQFAQKTVPDANNKQNIRFVSEVPQTVTEEGINALGYDVIATFKKEDNVKKVIYNVEGTDVFTSLTATKLGTTDVVAAKDNTYFFALTITDVPTSYGEIFLEVKTYSKVGDEKTYAAESAQFCFNNGETSTTKLLYAENFDNGNATTSTEIHTELGWGTAAIASDGVNASYVDDGTVKFTGRWGISTILEKNDMTNVTKYSVEFDVKITDPIGTGTSASVFNLTFNQNTSASDFTKAKLDTAMLSLREINDKGVVAVDGGKLGATFIRYYLNGSNTAQNLTPATYKEVTQGFSSAFKLKLDVDTVAKTAVISINGTEIVTYTETDVENTHKLPMTAGCIGFWTQNCNAYIDNLIVTDLTPVAG